MNEGVGNADRPVEPYWIGPVYDVVIPSGTTVIVEGAAYQLKVDTPAQGQCQWITDRFHDPITRKDISLPRSERPARMEEYFTSTIGGRVMYLAMSGDMDGARELAKEDPEWQAMSGDDAT